MEANDTMAVNAKTFRKIAKMIRGLVDHIRKEKSLSEKLARESFDQIDDLAKEALAKPQRNCDRFNTGNPMKDAEDAYDAWQRYCDDPTIPPSCKVESAFRQWIFATAKPETEGETDGSK